jgi:hypothetical protein
VNLRDGRRKVKHAKQSGSTIGDRILGGLDRAANPGIFDAPLTTARAESLPDHRRPVQASREGIEDLMKSHTTERPVRVGLISLGCAKNLVDAEVMVGTLLRDGIEITNDAAQADVVIVNTC